MHFLYVKYIGAHYIGEQFPIGTAQDITSKTSQKRHGKPIENFKSPKNINALQRVCSHSIGIDHSCCI